MDKNSNLDYVAIAISLFAIFIAFIGAFPEYIYGFDLDVYADDILLTRGTSADSDPYNVPLILPIIFINQGYDNSVIRDIVLLIKNDGDKSVKKYTPIVEVDFQKFISGKRALHAENIEKKFLPFHIEKKSSLIKYIVFTQEEEQKYPFSKWTVGNYTIQIYIKTSNSDEYKLYKNIPVDVDEKLINSYNSGNSIYLIGKRNFSI